MAGPWPETRVRAMLEPYFIDGARDRTSHYTFRAVLGPFSLKDRATAAPCLTFFFIPCREWFHSSLSSWAKIASPIFHSMIQPVMKIIASACPGPFKDY